MTGDLEFLHVTPANDPAATVRIRQLLAQCQLDLDCDIDIFVSAEVRGQMVACAGLSGNIIKCVAICPQLRGESLSLRLVSEVVQLAAERGHFHLFLYAKPENVPFFQGCGFYPLVAVPDTMVLMENSPVAMRRYCDTLAAAHRVDGERVGCIVMNANPFTLGHRYLAEQAAQHCDWLHVFVVREDLSLFPYADRYRLVAQGLEGIPRLTLHHGSSYMISRATFPGYFLKDKGIIDSCHTAVDLLLFREYIAPALGITHRFVGTEPFCAVTEKYNRDMAYWLQQAPSAAPAVHVSEIARKTLSGTPISASEVRRLLCQRDFGQIEHLVPDSTLALLQAKYVNNAEACAQACG
ncbi:MAG: [citrate (pro-3S)-lyase] ligase [Paludibacterium sp.]|uniref:[citrate (pro-3S)-lyase] ligase n=1 Tax=Paludibacterium sp. TaxID=1917523 RepID=UPI0025EE1B22|nr:[citrate (pro-3S)-lyase] ligase [Paludibacterium sp.]MBV8045703.1 [citrate (pro-3S)-lyase] ligase [Paludibacterium sp.]MBV8649459.1 [citrate (pro-3S)-lyase] ligase [Paludibacterium sp.]